MSYTSQNFHSSHVSNLSVRNFNFFGPYIRGQRSVSSLRAAVLPPGLCGKEQDGVKLHCTLMNVTYLLRDMDKSSPEYERTRRSTFDASAIMKVQDGYSCCKRMYIRAYVSPLEFTTNHLRFLGWRSPRKSILPRILYSLV